MVGSSFFIIANEKNYLPKLIRKLGRYFFAYNKSGLYQQCDYFK